MKKPVIVDAKQAVDMIRDGSTICTIGMTLISASETVLKEIERRFLEEGHPCNLTYFHTCGQAAMKQPGGLQHMAHEGLTKRVIGGHWGQSNLMMDLIAGNKIEAFNLPQGQMANMFHSMALKEPGKISKVGIGTYIDPRIEGGKMNAKTKECGYDEVAIINIDGEDYIQYKEVPIDTLLIRGTYADENGNISTEEEGMVLEVLPAVMATKRWGGKVICQVKKIVKAGSINPKSVTVPGVLVDAVVVCDNPLEDHRQTYSWFYDPAYCGNALAPESASEPLPVEARKIIGRRALMELHKDQIINIGTGIPNDVIGSIIAEENIGDMVTITVESGIYGGVPAQTIDFGISMNAQALIPHDRQFEYYNGSGIDCTFMGAGEMDQYGNVNATKMGPKAPGAGGFIDITATAKTVVFCSTFTGGGLKTQFDNQGIHIEQEGRIKKLVKEVQQISYNGKVAVERNQNMFYVTERAVFKLTKEGPLLIEVAKGVDLQHDILDQMEFKPLVADELQYTDTSIYEDGQYGLENIILNK
ncbi:acyl CoA:acetate/3-ketoacid CoA transferase [Anaerobium acetethylicum]|uniref:Propionate CoA-transferase n=1 Tax=Anaerobium acetethylicum TaxID=1619234 RepID=A0A1D3TYD7_9FIRM|nr:CoA-transferase [Anaerobium acetethylicum]SCP99463.1 propionate CoA-transferase [Anaerobium acetethylicum]